MMTVLAMIQDYSTIFVVSVLCIGAFGLPLLQRATSPLFRIPGPLVNKLSYVPITYQDQYCKRTIWSKSLHDRYGPIVVLSPNEISVTSNEGIRDVYNGSPKVGLFPKGPLFQIFTHYGARNLFSAIHAEDHGWRRKIVAQAYAQTSIVAREAATGKLWALVGDYIGLINREGLQSLQRKEARAIDVYMANIFFAIDGVSSHLFSRGMSALKGEEQSRRIASTSSETPELVNTYLRVEYKDYLYFLDLINRLFSKLVKPSRGKPPAPGRVRSMQNVQNVFYGGMEVKDWGFKRFIETKEALMSGELSPAVAPSSARLAASVINGEQQGTQMLKVDDDVGVKIAPQHSGDPKRVYTNEGAASECMDQLFAGMDTTGDTLSYLMYHISLPRNRPVQIQLQAELIALQLPSNHTNSLTQEEINHIIAAPTLDAVIKETLRVFPAGASALHRSVPKGGRIVEEYFLPEDTIVGSAPTIINRSQAVFDYDARHDVTEWRPARWEASKTRLLDMDRRFWAFSSGGRGCIGKNLAMLEMKLLIAGIYSKSSTFVDDQTPLEIKHDHWTCRSTFRDIAFCKEAKGVIAFAPLP